MTYRVVAFCDNPSCSNSAPTRETGFLGAPQAPLGWLHVDVAEWEDTREGIRHLDLCSAACHGQILDLIAEHAAANEVQP